MISAAPKRVAKVKQTNILNIVPTLANSMPTFRAKLQALDYQGRNGAPGRIRTYDQLIKSQLTNHKQNHLQGELPCDNQRQTMKTYKPIGVVVEVKGEKFRAERVENGTIDIYKQEGLDGCWVWVGTGSWNDRESEISDCTADLTPDVYCALDCAIIDKEEE